MIDILLCDDHPLLLRGLTDLIAAEPGMRVVATTCDGEEALAALDKFNPELAVIDLALPGLSGLNILQFVEKERRPVRIVLLTASISDAEVVQAVAAGVSGIVLKEAAPATLVRALREVAGGGRWLPPEVVRAAILRAADASRIVSPLDQLTRREREVAQLVADGRSNRDAASALGISEGTVKIHLHSIYSKLQVDNRTAVAILYARSRGDLSASR
jgi:DNA-binding NarL/FixJ family response regulator